MFKLLNRFAWTISIILSLSIILIFWWFRMFFYEPFIWIIIITIISLIIKKILFSADFIQERLEFFADALEKGNIPHLNSHLLDKRGEATKKEIEFKKEEKEILDLSDIIQEKEDSKGFAYSSLKSEENIYEKTKKINEFEDLEEKENIQTDYKTEKFEEKNYEPSGFEIFFEKAWNHIKEFFSTNILAKVWGILLFLMVVYFLKWVAVTFWEVIWPVGRISLWIIIGFIVYWIWTKIYEKYNWEWLILMWTGILINYAVILAGEYLVWDWWYLSQTTTFLFLILNTVFWILTSIIYKSKTLLIFSFVFAYLNPFIIWASGTEPYTLVWYSLIVSLWALFLANKQNNLTLLIISFIAWNFLFLVAPFSDSLWWSIKLISTVFLSLVSIKIAYDLSKDKVSNKWVLHTFLWAYIFILLNLFYSWWILNETLSFFVYNLVLIWLFAFSIYFLKKFVKNEESGIISIFFIPFAIIILILFSWSLIFSPFVLALYLILFLVWFSAVEKNISSYYKYFSFVFLWIFIFLFDSQISNFSNNWIINLNNLDLRWLNIVNEYYIIFISSFIFLFYSYYYSTKRDLSSLFPIWTIWTIIILLPYLIKKVILLPEPLSSPLNLYNLLFLSIISIIIFAISNLVLPFINKKLLEKQNLYNLVIGTVAWVLFISFEIYNYWEIYFPWFLEWVAFLLLAIIYFFQAFLFVQKIWVEKLKTDSDLQNIFYTFAWVSISLFSVSMAFVFSNYPEILTTIWLFEATILYYIFSKNNSKKIFFAATILFLIWLWKFGILLDVVKQSDFKFLISFSVILSSFILNLFFIDSPLPASPLAGERSNKKNILSTERFNPLNNNIYKNIHYILHIIWMIIMWILLYEIIPSNGNWWSKFGIIIFITILWFFYSKLNTNFLKYVFVVIILWFSIFHIWDISNIFSTLEKKNLEYLKIMQYFVTFIFLANIIIWKKSDNKKILLALKIILWIYAFLISNIYILDIFKNSLWHFSLTWYWGLIASGLLVYWIQKDLQKYRTIWLYFLVLTIWKIFLYDVWEVWDITWRYIIFGILWVVLIVISTLYTKKYWDNLLKEFSFDNLKDKEKWWEVVLEKK